MFKEFEKVRQPIRVHGLTEAKLSSQITSVTLSRMNSSSLIIQ